MGSMLWVLLICSPFRYEDGDTILRKICSAADFVWSDAPLDLLGSVTSISFEDPSCLPMKDHALTTEEVCIYSYSWDRCFDYLFWSFYVSFMLGQGFMWWFACSGKARLQASFEVRKQFPFPTLLWSLPFLIFFVPFSSLILIEWTLCFYKVLR